jgi:protein-disulfide isomerase
LHLRLFIATLFIAALFLPRTPAGTAQDSPVKAKETPAAKVGEEIISLEEVHRLLQNELKQLDRERHRLIEEKLEQLVAQKLLESEAKRRGMSVDELIKQEVNAKAAKVGDAEIDAFIAQNRSRLSQPDDPQLRLKVWEHLNGQKVNQQREAYIRSLRAKAGVTVYIEEPAGARVEVDERKGFARGAKDAPVTIVEFSDFQCPYCQAATATMHQVMSQYAGKVKWIFRDFPIPNLHPLAPKAHEAARCAAEQGKFWEYHDLLFERSPRLATADLKQYARELKLSGEDFDKCLDGGKHQAAVAADVEEGSRLGATGTPTFFINGRMLVGAQPIAGFQKIIDGELAKKPAR